MTQFQVSSFLDNSWYDWCWLPFFLGASHCFACADMAVATCLATCPCCADSKEYPERVRYHASRFKAKQPEQAEQVLRRYDQRRQTANDLEVQKLTFHVASWVAKLSPAAMARIYPKDLSAVLLLARYLEKLKDAQFVCNQLRDLLNRVLEGRQSHLDQDGQWKVLSKNILVIVSDSIEEHKVPENPRELVEEIPDEVVRCLSTGTKAARLMQKAIQIWRNQACKVSQEEYVAGLEQALRDMGFQDMPKIRMIFRRAVAAMSPPRLASECAAEDGVGLQETHGTSGDFQGRLRRIAWLCLDYLDLTDPKVKPALQVLEHLLQKFQELASTQSTIGGRRHWLRLQVKSSQSASQRSVNGHQESVMIRPRRGLCEHGVQKTWCRQCQPCPHGKVKRSCVQCSGCPHGQLRSNCATCTGCPHGKFTSARCAICKPCPHGKVKRNCVECSGCQHGNVKMNCRECGGCPHGKARKASCALCRPCPHGKAQRYCKKNCSSGILRAQEKAKKAAISQCGAIICGDGDNTCTHNIW